MLHVFGLCSASSGQSRWQTSLAKSSRVPSVRIFLHITFTLSSSFSLNQSLLCFLLYFALFLVAFIDYPLQNINSTYVYVFYLYHGFGLGMHLCCCSHLWINDRREKVSLIFMYFQPCHTAHFDVLLIEYSHWFGTNFLSFRRLRNAGSGSKVSPCRIAVFLSFTHYSFWKLTSKQIKHKTSITISCIAHSLSSLFLDPIFSYLIE